MEIENDVIIFKYIILFDGVSLKTNISFLFLFSDEP